ncbi:hypothetical protein THRCLA_10014 [Thraustotheca clavata]|uniref:3'-5' exonuclease n=1 Tax=Thraustotheca clavata TaxID=74557 RepID=A0A1V9YSY6_9STRA|nr:hypothetical protein THRCLA_10014 [Thraustotheca clavata]
MRCLRLFSVLYEHRGLNSIARSFSSRRRGKRNNLRQYAEDDNVGMASALSAKAIQQVLDEETHRIQQQRDGPKAIDTKRQKRWENAMEKKKARKQSQAYLQQPLFKIDSPALQAFGQRTLLDYESLTCSNFPGEIHIIETIEDEAPYLGLLEKMKVVGIDCESRPQMFGRYDPPIAMVQVTSQDCSLLYRIRRTSDIDGSTIVHSTFPGLEAFLANPDIVKIGHGCKGDFKGIQKDGIASTIRSTLDTLPLASGVGCLRPNLAALGLIWQRLRISKEMQTSDWECVALSPEQVQYAATDAWMARQVMLSLLQFPASHKFLHVLNYIPDRVCRGKSAKDTIAELVEIATTEGIAQEWNCPLPSPSQPSQPSQPIDTIDTL